MEKTHKQKDYFREMVLRLKERALTCANSDQDGSEFQKGRLLAFYEVIDMLKNDSITFGIEKELGLDDIKPDRDLVR